MPVHFDTQALPIVSRHDVAAHINAITTNERLTLVGRDVSAFRELLARADYLERPILFLDFNAAATAESVVTRILDDLAELALATWPDWRVGAATPWRRAAEKVAAAGAVPRFRRVAREIELRQLLDVLGDIVLVAGIDSVRAGSAAAAIAALEWAVRHGAAAVALLASQPTPFAPYDRILYGALEIEPAPMPIVERSILPPVRGPAGSVVEQRVRAALRRDEELAPLFESEVTLALGPLGPQPRVDLCWREGRVVVELDGPEHFSDTACGRDRHRDYELLVAGYLVLRLTNAQVQTDLQLAIEKIRNVVRLRRKGGAAA